ncbi:MAG TPA: serine/threonine-protein kinase, partial [Polyangiaceae bacterium]
MTGAGRGLIPRLVELAPGSIVGGRFVLERKLGEGGMGVVWAARHAVTRKAVAIKMLRADKAGNDRVRHRFIREARAASAVQHPNIIEIHDVIELENGAPAMVMDLLDGESLGDLLERAPKLSIEELAPIMLQVVSAVGSAHVAGVVHRDLKPDNIFLVRQGGAVSVRVLDFGIAKVIAGDDEPGVSHGLTNTGALLGTPFYMSPEQAFGEKTIGPRADVWAIGIILHECLSGRRPTEAENVGQILRIITHDEIPSLRVAAPEVPSDVADLVDRMLRRNPDHRPRSLVSAYDVLSRYAAGISARPFAEPSSVAAATSAAERDAATAASTTVAGTADDDVRSSRPVQSSLPLRVGAIVLVGVGVAFMASTSRQTPGSPAAASTT